MRCIFHVLPVALAGLLIGACSGSGTSRQVDIQVVESLEVQFGAMLAKPSYQAMSPLNNLMSDRDYVAYRDMLHCARLDPHQSNLKIATLSPALPSPTLSFRVDVAPRGTRESDDAAWTPLMRFAGAIDEGDAIPFTDPGVVIYSAGVNRWQQLALSSSPRVDVRFIGKVARPIDVLTVDVTLQLDLSTVPDGCTTSQ